MTHDGKYTRPYIKLEEGEWERRRGMKVFTTCKVCDNEREGCLRRLGKFCRFLYVQRDDFAEYVRSKKER